MALALNEARRPLLGPRTSLSAMSALARDIEDALSLSVTHSTQRSLSRIAFSRLSALTSGRDARAPRKRFAL
jgi:hypothetical protein